MKRAFLNNPHFLFAGSAAVAAFGARLLYFSGGRTEKEWGLVLLVVFGLASIVLPILIQRAPPA